MRLLGSLPPRLPREDAREETCILPVPFTIAEPNHRCLRSASGVWWLGEKAAPTLQVEAKIQDSVETLEWRDSRATLEDVRN